MSKFDTHLRYSTFCARFDMYRMIHIAYCMILISIHVVVNNSTTKIVCLVKFIAGLGGRKEVEMNGMQRGNG
jgi:hypothetical protein